jgi:hypothetical protein
MEPIMSDGKTKNIIPAVFFKIGKWVSIDKGTIVSHEDESPIMHCKDLSGDDLFIRFEYFKNDGNPTTTEVKQFFVDKANQMVTDKEIIKVKSFLEESADIDEEIEKLGLGRKEEREWLKGEARKIVLNNWSIVPGKWMRAAISLTQEKLIYDDKEYLLYESKSIIYDENDEPSKSGLYYITKNRHNIPVVVKQYHNGGECFLNKDVASYENFKSLINHSIRTAKRNIDFLPDFFTRDADWVNTCNAINKFKAEKKYLRYITGCEYLLESSGSEIVGKVFVRLPGSLKKSFNPELLNSDSNSILNGFKNGVQRIYYGKEDGEVKKSVDEKLSVAFNTAENSYGFYDIVSIGDEIEGNSYGFLTNNLNPRKTYYDIETLTKSIESL